MAPLIDSTYCDALDGSAISVGCLTLRSRKGREHCLGWRILAKVSACFNPETSYQRFFRRFILSRALEPPDFGLADDEPAVAFAAALL